MSKNFHHSDQSPVPITYHFSRRFIDCFFVICILQQSVKWPNDNFRIRTRFRFDDSASLSFDEQYLFSSSFYEIKRVVDKLC